MKKTLTLLIGSLLTFTAALNAQMPTERQTEIERSPNTLQRIEGILTSQTVKNQTYFVIASQTPIKLTLENNQVVIGRSFQIAGLDSQQWEATKLLVGKPVRAQGRLMEAHTPYHYTPILLITKKVSPLQ